MRRKRKRALGGLLGAGSAAAVVATAMIGAGVAAAGPSTATPLSPSAGWLPSVQFGSANTMINGQQIGLDGGGRATVTWLADDLSLLMRSDVAHAALLVSEQGAGGYAAPTRLNDATEIVGEFASAVADDGAAVVAWRSSTANDPAGLARTTALRVAVRPGPGQPWAPGQDVFRGASDGDSGLTRGIAVAADRGRVIVAYNQNDPDPAKSGLTISERDPGGTWGTPTVIAAGQQDGGVAQSPQVARIAYAADGSTYVLWQARSIIAALGQPQSRVMLSYRPAGGTFGTPQPLSGWRPIGLGAPDLAISTNSAIATWIEADGSGRKQVMVARSSDGVFAPAVSVAASSGAVLYPKVVSLAGSGALVAWTEGEGAWRLMSASDEGAGFGSPQQIASGTGQLAEPSIASDRFGTATAVWTVLTGQTSAGASYSIESAIRPTGTEWFAQAPLAQNVVYPSASGQALGSTTLVPKASIASRKNTTSVVWNAKKRGKGSLRQATRRARASVLKIGAPKTVRAGAPLRLKLVSAAPGSARITLTPAEGRPLTKRFAVKAGASTRTLRLPHAGSWTLTSATAKTTLTAR